MIIIKRAADLRAFLEKNSAFPAQTGFVPTMGALHSGHLSLLQDCKKQMKLSVVSIFVNPTQFNDPADFANYPITIENDIRLLEQAGCDVLFLPPVQEVYTQGIGEVKFYDLGMLEQVLEGVYRPGHFQGVCKVMDKLLSIVSPGHLFMGSKDYQQCMVVGRLIEIMGIPTNLHIVPTVRESDGLAMSSRNLRLAEEERGQAIAIYRQFGFIRQNALAMPLHDLLQIATGHLLKAGFHKVDYISVADPHSLLPLNAIKKGEPFQVLIAAFLGKVRLIDNMTLTA